eukprot:TRINITY_DN3496_c0_g1_i1.p1 TRINITY_DN3496_c0_g1~~TRINITY_DN3496_c0_g1_i1.p1  ORF type:complete len:288 (+),score=96.36 TRINITY_DN3496_c0_g1_i1:66-929(+)
MADAEAVRPAAPAHHEIAKDIGQQVESMILDAKQKSETMVGKELKKIKMHMDSMNEKIRAVEDRLARVEGGGGGLLRSDLHKSMQKLEEVWEGEVSTLKHELWQTIQAHNHNADLLKHHKDAIDQIQNRMKEGGPSPELENVHAQLNQVDKILQRESAKDQQIENFRNRLTLVQQQFQALTGGAGGALGGALGGPWAANNAAAMAAAAMANAAVMAGNTAAAMSSVGAGAAGAAAAAAGRQARPKKAANGVQKVAKTQKQSASAGLEGGLSLRAEAPEFVPTFSPDM